MKKILFLTTSPVAGGNGDALTEAAMGAADTKDTIIKRINVRDKIVNPCRACSKCAGSGVCVQKDDFGEILQAIHEADGIVASAPVYYNCMAAQTLLVVNRLCCTFAYKNYRIGPKKRVAVMLTCTGSEEAEMKRHVSNILTLPSVNRAIREFRTEVFRKCSSPSFCRDTEEYLEKARELGIWVTG